MRDLRANDTPARMIFAEIDAGVLHGLIDPGTPWLDHGYVEADLPSGTIAFDSHIVDRALFRSARKRCIAQDRHFGYGVHAMRTDQFGGFSQFMPDAIRGRIWGSYETVTDFQSSDARIWNRLPWIARLAFGLFANAANARAQVLRETA